MKLNKCKSTDFIRITNLYQYVIKNSPSMKIYGRWVYGQHPTDEMIKKYIDGGQMYYVEEQGAYLAAVALTPFQGEDYHPVEWDIELGDNEVFVVHILCVNPDMQRKGIARDVMLEVIEQAKKSGKGAVRLDVLACNEPAHRLYESLGFKRCGVLNWCAENTGWTDFYLYEYCL